MSINTLRTACFSGALGVALGAFGAHALKETLILHGALDTYKTAVLYHFMHSIVLLVLAFSPFHTKGALRRVTYLLVSGMILFSGSLYLLSTVRWGWLGPITPVGGALLIISWVYAAITARRPT